LPAVVVESTGPKSMRAFSRHARMLGKLIVF
jgi:hypothetical protein